MYLYEWVQIMFVYNYSITNAIFNNEDLVVNFSRVPKYIHYVFT